MQRSAFPLLFLVAALAAAPAPVRSASPREAAQRVRQGVDHFRRGEMELAEKAFAAAETMLPDDPRVTFNLACALAARGETQRAIESFKKVAAARDEDLAVEAHYNLGCALAGEGHKAFGDKPEEAEADTRKRGVDSLEQAVRHYRDALRIRPEHENARHNLELLRAWIKHMQAVWKKRDRAKRRELGLLQFFTFIEEQQESMREAVRELARRDDTSARRQLASRLRQQQRELAEEIGPLKAKIRAALSAKLPDGANPTAADDEDTRRFVGELLQFADKAAAAMEKAGENLGRPGQLESAPNTQLEALQGLNEVYIRIAPFESLVKKSIERETRLIKESGGGNSAARENDSPSPGDPPPAPEPKKEPLDFAELTWRQARVHAWTNIIPRAAQVAKGALALQKQPDGAETSPQQKQLLEAIERAFELSPEIQGNARSAAEQLALQDAVAALPHQEQALELLKKIFQQQKDDQKKDDEKKDDKDKEKQDEKDKQEDQEKKQDDPDKQKDGNEKDQEKQQDEQGEQDEKSQQQKDEEERKKQREQQQRAAEQGRKLSKEQALQILRRAREREQKHQRDKQRLRGLISAPSVKRDW